jgi:hypothetical protein
MAEVTSERFQDAVEEYLIRHKSVLDVITKFHESASRVNRAVAKSVTTCGCTEISARRQRCPEDTSFSDFKRHMDTHLYGELCPECREALELEIGRTLFYLTAMCSILDMDMDEIVSKENNRIKALGIFNLT